MNKKTLCCVPGCENEQDGGIAINNESDFSQRVLPLCKFCLNEVRRVMTPAQDEGKAKTVLHADDGVYLVKMISGDTEYRAEKVEGVWYLSDGQQRFLLEYPQRISSIKKIQGASAPDAATGQPYPVRREYSRAEIGEKAREFMEREYGKSFDAQNRDEWFQRYGFLIHFVHEHFPAE